MELAHQLTSQWIIMWDYIQENMRWHIFSVMKCHLRSTVGLLEIISWIKRNLHLLYFVCVWFCCYCWYWFVFNTYFSSLHILSSFLIFYIILCYCCCCSFGYNSIVSFFLVSFVCFSQLCPFITLLILDLLYFFMLTLALFLLILFLSPCSYKSFMLLTFWPFLYQR